MNKLELFESKINKNGPRGCWLWLGSRQRYGQFFFRGKRWQAHRFSYEIYVGMVGSLYVCHHCDNTICVNPTHLFLGTQKDNMQDMIRKGRANYARGEDAGLAKLTNRQAEYIKKHYSPKHPKFSGAALARKFGVTKYAVHDMVRGKSWKRTENKIDKSLRVPKWKLTKEQAQYIRDNYKFRHPEFGCKPMSEKFGVHIMTVSNVVTGKTWRGD